MVDLVQYASSDEEDSAANAVEPTNPVFAVHNRETLPDVLARDLTHGNTSQTLGPSQQPVDVTPSASASAPFVGPNVQTWQTSQADLNVAHAPSSQISVQSVLRSLTLPDYPNLDIPPSPPRSQNTNLDAKIQHFLSLKKQGIHFNHKLSAASSLQNPNLLQRLTAAAGLDEGTWQYEISMAKEVWDPALVSSYASVEELDVARAEAQKDRERAKEGRPREFEQAKNNTESAQR